MQKGIKNFIKNILFPIYCIGCKQEGEWWCKNCLFNYRVNICSSCPVCKRIMRCGEICSNCLKQFNLNGITTLFQYTPGLPPAELIKLLKYNSAFEVGGVWKNIFLNLNLSLAKNSVLVPVPLHPRRERQRGFNQAEKIASLLSNQLNFVLLNNKLWRVRYTRQQAKLSKFERQKNIAEAFAWNSNEKPPDNIILVDDVYTTGATMQECAKVLKMAGARSVWGFALARD
jgi:ComF family protein